MFSYLKVPVGWSEVAKRTLFAVNKDDVMGLAAQLAYAFFFALFPALICLVAVASFFPLHGLVDQLTSRAGNLLPQEMMSLITRQLKELSNSKQGGLLTFGLLLTIFSASSGMAAIISTLNHAYDITDSRPWWKVRLIAVGLTIAIGIFAVVSLALVMVGPQLAGKVANWVHLGPEFALAWKILEWPVVFALIATGLALVYYYGPDADQDWVWITPGSIVATLLWVLASLGFRTYLAHFNSYNATYGAIGGIMIALTWFYLSGIMLLVGAELNAEIEHASPYGKEPGEKRPGVRKKIGPAAARAWEEARRSGRIAPALAPAAAYMRPEQVTRVASRVPPRAQPSAVGRVMLVGLVMGEFAMAVYGRLRRRRVSE